MGNFSRLNVWKDSKDRVVQIYKLTNSGNFATDFSFRDQIRRAAISIPSNIAEGEESIFDKVSIKYFSIAYATLAELKTQAEIAKDIGYLTKEEYKDLIDKMVSLSKRIHNLIRYRQNQLNH